MNLWGHHFCQNANQKLQGSRKIDSFWTRCHIGRNLNWNSTILGWKNGITVVQSGCQSSETVTFFIYFFKSFPKLSKSSKSDHNCPIGQPPKNSRGSTSSKDYAIVRYPLRTPWKNRHLSNFQLSKVFYASKWFLVTILNEIPKKRHQFQEVKDRAAGITTLYSTMGSFGPQGPATPGGW